MCVILYCCCRTHSSYVWQYVVLLHYTLGVIYNYQLAHERQPQVVSTCARLLKCFVIKFLSNRASEKQTKKTCCLVVKNHCSIKTDHVAMQACHVR